MGIIQVRARDISKMSAMGGDKGYRAIIRSQPAKVLEGDWDQHFRLAERNPVMIAVRDVLLKKSAKWQDTRFYEIRLANILAGHGKRKCHNEADLVARCRVLEKLFLSIKESGFKTQEQLGFPNSRDHFDDIRVVIDRNGEVMFLDGRHRLAIARSLDLTIPVRVVLRHAQWADFRDKVSTSVSKGRRRFVYQKIDHPDLQNVNFGHGDERWPLIRPAIAGYSGPALDLGAHWGHYSQQLAKIGIETTAVEMSKPCCRFARRVARMPGSRFEVVHGDLCQTVRPERFKIVLALNIFHHFHKTKAGYDNLDGFLRKLRPEVMIFEGHVQKPNGQMKNAYRDLAPQPFAAWVAERVGLKTVEHLGDAKDGRAIFKLS